ncbi:DUF2087 domain-containing protein [Lederbergia panacisoli]|uniref:DUF2087 domain-containing protein n=1 Tax=Lederbergia panacisoli TaxID=1255251 RepID=UPI00214CAED1|nr:DUF2087 domain-containing protein [Lederbergia panacisoli]MCR2822554.1 DUF2087 domain-containing protein [Lederbergia panacisoli]
MMNPPNELKGFFNEKGQLKSWPAKRSKKSLAVEFLARKFDEGRTYSEKEVNAILEEWHTFSDSALLRRELFENKWLNRTLDGREYWKSEKGSDI